MSPKTILQNIFKILGYDIHKRDSRFHPEIIAKHLCAEKNLNVILDVGANIGQYGMALREWDYKGRILSFEPLSNAYTLLCKNANADELWQIAPRCAIGAKKSKEVINIAGNSVSSSLLNMLESHIEVAPSSAYIAKEDVNVETLSESIKALCEETDCFYLKIDTQGYERQVIEGASECLDRIPAIQMELSLRSLYENSLMLEEGIALMKTKGYRVYSLHPGFSDRTTGETLQIDAIFVR